MNTKSLFSFAAVLVFLAAAPLAPAAENLTNTLQNGLFEEEANHNLAAAVKDYQAVIARLDEDRKLAATAVFRLAECYRKLGQTNEANVQYERVLRDFSDQTHLVELSRLNLNEPNPSLSTAAASLDIVADGKVYHPATEEEADQLRTVMALTKDSPDLVNTSVNGPSRLYSAAQDGRLAIAEYLLDHESETERNSRIAGRGFSPLQIAAQRGHRTIVQLLLDHGFLVDGRSPGGPTPLECAAQRGYLAVAEILVAHGAKVNDTENGPRAPLLQAVAGNEPAMAKFLIHHGADLNAASDSNGRTALHLAVGTTSLELTRLLLDHNAMVNPVDNDGNTPLILAIRGDQPTTKYQSRVGTNTLWIDSNDSVAKRRWNQQSAALTNIIALLIGHHGEVNATNHLGQTALHWIALVNAHDTLKLLLANKAHVNALDENAMTPLRYAVAALDSMNVGILLEHGANPNLKDVAGQTPLAWLEGRIDRFSVPERQNAKRIESLLLAHGAVMPEPQPSANLSLATAGSTTQPATIPVPAGMALIPGGTFTMGDTLDGDPDAKPVTTTVSSFYMDTNLVSYALWINVQAYATTNGYHFVHPGTRKAANHPVVTVNWFDCVEWCNARSQQAGLTPVYYTDAALTQVYTNGEPAWIYPHWAAYGFRLPTEAEWEYAARGGLSGQRFPWGMTISESQANYQGTNGVYKYDLGPSGYNASFANGDTPYTSPVGSFAPNGYGLFDMAGNAWQWCWDWVGIPYAGGSNPRGPASGPYRVFRGGCWYNDAFLCRSAQRYALNPAYGNGNIGFRTVLSPRSAPAAATPVVNGKGVVSVLGEVQKPGIVEFSPEKPLTLPEAIARAGGLTKQADRRQITILRQGKRILFNWESYRKSPENNPVPALEDGDVVNVSQLIIQF